MDIVLEKRPAEVAKDVFRGLKLIWFSKRPGFLVVPLTLLFFVFIIVFGGTKLILYVYLEAPPFGFGPEEITTYMTFQSVCAILCSVLMLTLEFLAPKLSSWVYVIFGIACQIANSLGIAFSSTKLDLYLTSLLTLGFYAAIPALRKLMTDCVDESLLGSLYSIPALVEGTGYPLGFIIYSACFLGHQNQENWIFYGLGSILMAIAVVFTCITYYVKKIYFR